MVKDHSVDARKPTATTWGTLRLAARDILNASSHRQDITYHYTSCGAQAGKRNSSSIASQFASHILLIATKF